MTSFIKNCIISGSSVIGQSHVINGTCNQDFFSIKRTNFGVALSVCDGVGSNKYSQYGSRAASKAVNKVFKLYYKHKVNKEDCGKKIWEYYKKYVNKKYRNAAGTTCLFVLIYNNNDIMIGQAGDGIILIKIDDRFIAFKNKTDDFMNEVNALTCNYYYDCWKIKNLKFDASINHKLEFLLSTDGISEDIIPEKKEDFFDYFIGLTPKKGKSNLKKTIKNWSVPGSIDDKTVITFSWRN